MLTHSAKPCPLLAAGLALGLLALGPCLLAQDPKLHLPATIDRIEEDLGARSG